MRTQNKLLVKMGLLLSLTVPNALSSEGEKISIREESPRRLHAVVHREQPETVEEEKTPTIKHKDESNSVTRISQAPWRHLQPYLTALIEQTITNPTIEERNFCFQVKRDDWRSFCEWYDSFSAPLRYPIGMGSANVGAEGDRVNGVYELYHKKLTIHNYTKREESARAVNEYRFFGGKLDESLLNKRTFYNLMARVGFTEADFANGSTGLQGRILVKPIQLQSLTLVECGKELEGILLPTLQKSPEQYITFVFNLSPQAEFTLNDIFSDEGRLIGAHIREFNNLATIYEYDEKRIYLTFVNDRRKILDLHGFEKDGEFFGITAKGALKLVRDYITEQYDDFQSECTICTGIGNHQNANGSKGVLLSAFPQWMQHEDIKALVIKTKPIGGGGGFKVFLKQPIVCDLTRPNLKADQLQMVAETLQRVISTGGDRLKIMTTDPRLDHKVISFIALQGESLECTIPTLSFSYAPGELRLTLCNSDDGTGELVSSQGKSKAHKGPRVTFGNPQQEPLNAVVPTHPKAVAKAVPVSIGNNKNERPVNVKKKTQNLNKGQEAVSAKKKPVGSKPAQSHKQQERPSVQQNGAKLPHTKQQGKSAAKAPQKTQAQQGAQVKGNSNGASAKKNPITSKNKK